MTVLQQLRAVVAFLYCLAGIAGCVTFLILGNYAATIWAFISGGKLIHIYYVLWLWLIFLTVNIALFD